MPEPTEIGKHDVESKLFFMRQLQHAVELNQIADFVEMVDAGVGYFDEETVAALLTRELPLMLGERLTYRMHWFMWCAMRQAERKMEAD